MLRIDDSLSAKKLLPAVGHLFELSAEKILRLEKRWRPESGSPVITVKGRYTTRGWTEWTQGFQFGSALLQFDASNDPVFLELGRQATRTRMAAHVSHTGVHDHGFNNVSTYGNLLRLTREGRIAADPWERNFYELALKISGAVQAARWTKLTPEAGYIYSFNGPHSLFSDTIRSLRVLALSHQLGHCLMGENDTRICLRTRLLQHAEATARHNVYLGRYRDAYDVRGRVAQESIFNTNDGGCRCPSTQQGYSPFSTWTRGQAWILCGFAEQLEFLATLPQKEFSGAGGKNRILKRFEEAATAVADYWLAETPTDGIPYWDTAAPGLVKLKNCNNRPADPFNEHEPVDSSAAVIAAQGLLRLGNYLKASSRAKSGRRYRQAALTIAKHLFQEPYLSTDARHEGLILHSVYHRPNGWDYVPTGATAPCGEASMWGDYHARELGLMVQREATNQPYYAFFLPPGAKS